MDFLKNSCCFGETAALKNYCCVKVDTQKKCEEVASLKIKLSWIDTTYARREIAI